jgi:hypothetical protein
MCKPVEAIVKNLTLAIDESLLKRSRAFAEERGTTVNAIIRAHLEQLTGNAERLAQAKRELLALSEKTEADLGPNYRFNREEIYAERDFPRHEHPDLRGFREEE